MTTGVTAFPTVRETGAARLGAKPSGTDVDLYYAGNEPGAAPAYLTSAETPAIETVTQVGLTARSTILRQRFENQHPNPVP